MICAKTEYACLAVMELAKFYGSGDVVRLKDIAEEHDIPSKFLVQILLQLKSAGLVTSTRGASGGYQLIRDPAELTLCDVMSTVDASAAESSNVTNGQNRSAGLLNNVWTTAAEAQRQVLESITIAELVQQAADVEPMYYI